MPRLYPAQHLIAGLLLLLSGIEHALADQPDAGPRVVKVELAADLASLTVRIPGDMGRLQAHKEEVWSRLVHLTNGRRSGRFVRPVNSTHSVTYQVNLEHAGTEWAIASWHQPLRISDWTDWLLTPVGWSEAQPFELRIEVPDQGRAVLPFQVIENSPGLARYRATPIMPEHGGLAVFGNVQLERVSFKGRRLFVAVVGDQGSQSSQLVDWVTGVAEVAVSLHKAAPGHDALVAVFPVPLVGSVVPWAHVKRGGGSHVIAYVQEGAEMAELTEDWTLFHEMAHLYYPYLHSGGRWVSEGFASYYQNVYRAAGGVVEPRHAWQRLVAGWERGRKENETNGNRPVTQGGRMRTYWTAAAMAYEADLALRAQGQTLAEVMGQFASGRMPVDRSWHPRDYMAALDETAGRSVLVPLYDDYVRDRFFPEPAASDSAWRIVFDPQK